MSNLARRLRRRPKRSNRIDNRNPDTHIPYDTGLGRPAQLPKRMTKHA